MTFLITLRIRLLGFVWVTWALYATSFAIVTIAPGVDFATACCVSTLGSFFCIKSNDAYLFDCHGVSPLLIDIFI
jgi:hypothetical protein